MSSLKGSAAFLEGVHHRRSIYQISDQNPPVPDAKIEEIVQFAVKHVPSTFNVQSARVVILFGQQHKKLWDLGDAIVKKSVPEGVYEKLHPRVEGFRAGYGSVLFFEDEERLIALQQKNAMITHVIPEWSDHSSGMHQFVVWTALELEGFGCNLQHYNYSSEFHKAVLDTWDLPSSWKLKSQLNFGVPTGPYPEKEKTFDPIEERVKVFR